MSNQEPSYNAYFEAVARLESGALGSVRFPMHVALDVYTVYIPMKHDQYREFSSHNRAEIIDHLMQTFHFQFTDAKVSDICIRSLKYRKPLKNFVDDHEIMNESDNNVVPKKNYETVEDIDPFLVKEYRKIVSRL